MTNQNDPQSHLPLQEATFFILLSLAPDPKHGYAIMKDVEDLSEGRVTLSTGTLYGALKRLLEQGWIERVEDPAPDETQRVRKHYTLTRLGWRILDAEAARLQALVVATRLRMSGEQA
jgi:DNA-binding PadR family transcriptional regulator